MQLLAITSFIILTEYAGEILWLAIGYGQYCWPTRFIDLFHGYCGDYSVNLDDQLLDKQLEKTAMQLLSITSFIIHTEYACEILWLAVGYGQYC